MKEEHIRLFLQGLSKTTFNNEQVILELEEIMSELRKVNLAIPPITVQLKDIRELNREALLRARESSARNPTHNGHLNGLVVPVTR